MKILGKDVVIATKKLCIEYTTNISGDFHYKGQDLEYKVIFFKDKNEYYIELDDIKSFPTLSLICYGAAKRWKKSPMKTGDEYVDNIKPYFSSKSNQEELFDVNTLIKILTIEKKIENQEINISIN